jgi:hypothetical protein
MKEAANNAMSTYLLAMQSIRENNAELVDWDYTKAPQQRNLAEDMEFSDRHTE